AFLWVARHGATLTGLAGLACALDVPVFQASDEAATLGLYEQVSSKLVELAQFAVASGGAPPVGMMHSPREQASAWRPYLKHINAEEVRRYRFPIAPEILVRAGLT